MSGGYNELGGWLAMRGETSNYRHVITVENGDVGLHEFNGCELDKHELGRFVEYCAAVASMVGALLIDFGVA